MSTGRFILREGGMHAPAKRTLIWVNNKASAENNENSERNKYNVKIQHVLYIFQTTRESMWEKERVDVSH